MPKTLAVAARIIVAVALLTPAAASAPLTAVAASSCTGWDSRLVPPSSIRVGREDGTVETVDFRRYVGVVMAKEWPAWMPAAALQAGATAVKQYGWFYTLAGKHRSSYVNAEGECFDVRDGTVDQLYRPEKVTVADKIWRAVDATWGLSVRKDGKFFLTGYRAGSSGVCASDVDGWKLFAKSVIDCAEDGWTRQQIQTAYYAPNVTFHWAEAAADAGVDTPISAPKVALVAGRTLGGKHARVAWDNAEARPPGTQYELQQRMSGEWRAVALADPTRSRIAIRIKWGETHRFRVRLVDAEGNAGPWHAGPAFDARLVQDTSDRMAWSDVGWERLANDGASGGSVTSATDASSQAALAFTGRSVALIGTLGPSRGTARVFIDGVLEAEVDLHASTNRWKVLVFARSWSESAAHTIRVEVVGDGRVDIDGVLFHR